VLTLDVDARSYGLYANTPIDHARRTLMAAAGDLTGDRARQTAFV
jgi:hypothetical protein